MRKNIYFTIIAAIAISGCAIFSGKTSDAEIVFPVTEVGTPEGEKVAKDIGPAGGTIASPDGRLTLTVPQNALTDTIAFSIQPITNKAEGGTGVAYRLSPDGATFATPLQLSVRYDEQDLRGTTIEAMSIAYQDKKGAWHELKPVKRDEENSTLTVSTTHFTDVTNLPKLRLSPDKATVRVGESVEIKLIGCQEENLLDKLIKIGSLGEQTHCRLGFIDVVNFLWEADIGTVVDHVNPTTYTAPQKKPSPNVATVSWVKIVDRDVHGFTKKGGYSAKITIIDRGYKATGQSHDMVYSGDVCDVEKPFTIKGTGLASLDFKFVPSGTTSGTVSYATAYNVPGMRVKESSSGVYKLASDGSDGFDLVLDLSGTAQTSRGDFSGDGAVKIHLTPLASNEGGCG